MPIKFQEFYDSWLIKNKKTFRRVVIIIMKIYKIRAKIFNINY